uniref:Zinc knuckle CX2CX4HX4C domain-containing protein n=1 Tax=Nelumbo nucifera TaxID=4432 RepID=A0A822XIN3_NELNU|nr:TPA_asm: hypothetical protein HUJ06_020098 [Nelumbo nucifera]
MVKFLSKFDCDEVFDASPWNFNGDFILMAKCEANRAPSSYQLDSVGIWVQLSNLPVEYLTIEVAKSIASTVGKPVNLEPDVKKWCKFARIKVQMSIYQPLIKSVPYTLLKWEEITVPLAYERLPRFCSLCGLLGHELERCKIRFDIMGKIEESKSPEFRKRLQDLLKINYSEELRGGSVIQSPSKERQNSLNVEKQCADSLSEDTEGCNTNHTIADPVPNENSVQDEGHNSHSIAVEKITPAVFP